MYKDPHLLAEPGKKIRLEDYPTDYTGDFKDKKAAGDLLDRQTAELSDLQEKLYADKRFAILIILQGMDASGKDSTIKQVLTGINPQGCRVHTFKQPSAEELSHDYMWRIYKAFPERGQIGIFNRSHYEEVLIARVHPRLILRQNIPGIDEEQQVDNDFFDKRYRQINDIERHLSENGTIILKFFLHLSKKEQKKRFLSRIEKDKKNWKFELGDLKERGHWDDYQKAFEKAINGTSTKYAPWYIIPADNKWFMQLAVSNIIKESLQKLDLDFPTITNEMRDRLAEAEEELRNEK